MMFETERMRIKKRRRNNAIVILVSLVAIAIFWSKGEHKKLGFSSSMLSSVDEPSEVTDVISETVAIDNVELEAFDPRSAIEQLQKSDQPISKRKVLVQEWRTSRGAKVLFMPTSDLPMVDIRVIFDAGSARENDFPGASQFVAGLLGKASKKFSETEIVNGFESVGAQFSASAHRDMSVVHLRSLSEPAYFDTSIELFVEALAHPTFPVKEMERLRAQAKTGLIKRKELPADQATDLFMKAIYQDHPYGRVLTVENVEVLKRRGVKAFYDKYYTAQNASFAIVGDLSRMQAESFVENLSTMLPSGTKPGRLPDPPVLEDSIVIEHQFPSTQAHVKIGRWMLARNDPDFEAIYMADQILGGSGFSSILSDEVRQKKGLAYSVSSGFSGMNSKGPFSIEFQTKVSDYKLAIEVSNQVLTDLVVKGVDQERFDRVKKYVVGSFPLMTASNESIVGYLGAMAFYDLPADYLDRFVEKLASIDAQTVNAMTVKYWKDAPMVTVVVGDINAGNDKAANVESDQKKTNDDL